VASERAEALRRALELTPDDNALRLILAETLAEDGFAADAATEYRTLLDQDAIPADELIAGAGVALEAGDFALAGDLADAAQQAGIVEGVSDLRRTIDSELGLEGVMQIARHGGPDGTAPAFDFDPAGMREDDAGAGYRDGVRAALLERPDRGDRRPDVRHERAQPP
jgi:hypothetical protein